MTSEQYRRGTAKENPDVYLPEWMKGTSTKAEHGSLWILTVHGECSCGNWARQVAPDWKVPAEWGGGYMTDDCMGCLGTMEYEDRWERVDRVVGEWSALKPPESSDSNGDWSHFVCMECGTEGEAESFEDLPHKEWCDNDQ